MARTTKAAWLLAAVGTCAAQQPVARPIGHPVPVSAAPAGTVPAAASTVLLQMASHAGVIFSGQVVSVDRGTGCVDVRFRIDQAVRGVAAGSPAKASIYVLREWSGLWSGNPDRYRVGQRLLMILPARGASGMSSPVGGLDGAIPLIATGTAPVADAAGVAPVDTGVATPELAVDLRWIEARALRPAASAQLTMTTGSVAALPTALLSVLTLLRGTGVSASSEVRNARY